MKETLKRLYIDLKYHYIRLKSKVLYGTCARWFSKRKVFFVVNAMIRRLVRKGCSVDKYMNIMDRYTRMKKHISRREARGSQKRMMNIIVKISDDTGIPQWELRALLQRDFDIDV